MDYLPIMTLDPKPSPQARSDDTRRRLIDAALKLFGTYGYDAVTTRRLVREAGVNQVAIPYHFGGKEGLYIAVAEHIVARLGARLAPALEASGPEDALPEQKEAAIALLRDILLRMARQIVGAPESEHFARFVVREQMDPTPAFDVLYTGLFGRLFKIITRLFATALGHEEVTEPVAVRALSLVGQFIVFRIARTAAERALGWNDVGPREMALIEDVIDANLYAILKEARQ